MAPPQVSTVSAQNFGCVLRDRNQRHDGVLDKNLKALVKDHHRHPHHLHHHHDHRRHHQQFPNRVSADSAVSEENSQTRIDSWIENQQKQNRNNRLRPPETQRPRKDSNFSEISKPTNRVLATTHKHCPKESANLAPRESVPRNERSDNSKSDEKIGASSLVQIWEARLIRSNGGNPPSQDGSTASSSRRSSGVSVQETICSGPSIDGESEPSDEPDGEPKNSDRTVEIKSGSVSESSESKWGRVADIIKQLSNEQKQLAGKNGGERGVNGLPTIRTPRPCLSTCSSTVSEKSIFPVVACSPRILRGRQAFTDLLLQLERNRYREVDSLLERNAVSKFPQRGRLQSMLRLRSLQRCLAIQDRHRSYDKTTDLNRRTSSAVLHLRERFTSDAANAATAAAAAAAAATEQRSEVLTENESKITCLHQQETRDAEGLNGKSESEDNVVPSASVTHLGSPETELQEKKEDNGETTETPETMSGMLESDQEILNLEEQETSCLNEWEEYEDEQSYYGDANYDWFSEISRPRSYWEDLRKNRYMEVMNARSEKKDILTLLERRTVSSFLQSDLRENIDRLIMSRSQGQLLQRVEEQTEKWEIAQELNQEEEEVEEEEEKVEVEREEEEQEQIEEEDQDSDYSSHSSSQMFSPSPGGSWSSRDTGVTSTPILPTHNHHSPEMELINDLRAQIQQLQREMTDLRDSVKTCMDVNTRLQQSVHQENPLKRKCCVCNETQVEALLYRCGHMCTCLKCANELQWNGGKCPICRAQILDVVRVFVDPRS